MALMVSMGAILLFLVRSMLMLDHLRPKFRDLAWLSKDGLCELERLSKEQCLTNEGGGVTIYSRRISEIRDNVGASDISIIALS